MLMILVLEVYLLSLSKVDSKYLDQCFIKIEKTVLNAKEIVLSKNNQISSR